MAIETIKFEDVEKNLPNGVPTNIRALDSSGNSISSSIKNVREVMGIYSLIRSLSHLKNMK